MRRGSFCVARMDGDRLDVLAEGLTREVAMDVADRAKFMRPVVFFCDEHGPVEAFTATSPSIRLLPDRGESR